METDKRKAMFSLSGEYKGKKYEHLSTDIKFLQSFLTKLLRHNATGYIWRLSNGN